MTKKQTKTLCVLLIGIIVCSSGIFLECLPQASATGSWLDGYAYRKTQTIIGSTGAGYNYQLYYQVYRTTGVDNGNTVYLSGKCKADFSDVRFADTQTPPVVFSYWIAKKTSDYAEFWINASTVNLDNNATIAIYYGNQDATDESNFEATFVFGELWNNATLDTAKWLSSGTTPNVSIDTVQHRATITSGSTSGCYYAMINLPDNYIIEDAYTYKGNIYVFNDFTGSSATGNFYVGVHHTIPSSPDYLALGLRFYEYLLQQPLTYVLYRHLSGTQDDWTSYNYMTTGSITVSFRLWRVGSTNVIYDTAANRNITRTSSELPNRFVFGTSMSYGGSINDLGAFKIRKYVDTEPIQAGWNSEETPPAGPPSNSNNVQVFWSTGGSGISINGQTVTQNGSWVACQGNVTIGALTKSSVYLFNSITVSNNTSNLLTTLSNPTNFILPSENITIWCNFAAVGSIQPYTYARFVFVPSNPTAGNTSIAVNGTLSVSNEPIYSYLWDFGDNTTSTEVCTSHTYMAQGTYAISLTVTSDAGKDTFTQLINVS